MHLSINENEWKPFRFPLTIIHHAVCYTSELCISYSRVTVQHCLNNSEKQCLIFVTGQGGGRRQCGGIVDWRQRRTGANSRCCIHCYLRNAVLVQYFFDNHILRNCPKGSVLYMHRNTVPG